MMTLKQKAIALSVVVLFNLGVLLLAPLYLLLAAPVSALFVVLFFTTNLRETTLGNGTFAAQRNP